MVRIGFCRCVMVVVKFAGASLCMFNLQKRNGVVEICTSDYDNTIRINDNDNTNKQSHTHVKY